MSRSLAALPLVLALAVAGCGDSKKSAADQPAPQTNAPAGTATAATESGRSVDIAMKNIQFSPKEQTVPVGTKVIWTNEDDVDHNVVATDGADFKSENFGKDGTYVYTARKGGPVKYTCTLHPGMDGELKVTGGKGNSGGRGG